MQKKKPSRKEKVSGPAESADLKVKIVVSPPAIWMPISIVLIALIAYASTLSYGFVLDDYSAIIENKSTQKGISAIAEFFTTSYRYGYVFSVDELYRPLTKAVFGLQWSLAPSNPFIGHLMNVLVYAATVLLIFRLVRTWTKGNDLLAWLTAVLFAVMPIHTEVVANIKSIDELLGLFFCLLALRSAHTYSMSGSTRNAILTAVWFFLALCSKESSVTVLAVFPLAAWYFSEAKGLRRWMPMLFSLVSLLLFMGLRAKAIGPAGTAFVPSSVDNMLVSVDFLKRECTAVYLLGKYLFTIVVGFPLSFDNSWPQISYMTVSSPLFLLSAIVLLALFIVALRGIGKKDVLSFGLLFFFVTVSLVSNIFLIIGTQWGERLMYLPGLGIALAMAVVLHFLIVKISPEPAKQLRSIVVVGVVFAIFFGGMTIARNPVWKSNESIYLSGLISAPRSTRVNYYLGNFYQKEEYLAGKDSSTRDSILKISEKYLRTSLSLSPNFVDAWNQLGLIYYRKKAFPEAMHIYEQGIATGQADATLYNNAGTVYFSSGMVDKAISAFNTAVRMNPHYSEAWSNLGSSYGQAGQLDQAIGYFERAVKEDPRNKQAWYFLGVTWRNKGNEALAQQYLSQAEAIK